MRMLRRPNEILVAAIAVVATMALAFLGIKAYLVFDYNRAIELAEHLDHDTLLQDCRSMMRRYDHFYELTYGQSPTVGKESVILHLDRVDHIDGIPNSIRDAGFSFVRLTPSHMYLKFPGLHRVAVLAFDEEFDNEYGVEELRDGLWLDTGGQITYERDLPDHPPSSP